MSTNQIDTDKYDNYVFDLYGTLIDVWTDEHEMNTWEKWSAWLDAHGYRHASCEEMHKTFFDADLAARKEALKSWGYEVPEIDVTPIYRRMLLEYGNPEEMLTPGQLSDIGYAFRTASRKRFGLFDGVIEFMDKLHRAGKKTYILSNAQRCYTWPEICYFSLDRIMDDILISSDERCMKPDSAFFAKMADKHGFELSRTIMFGDSLENDYEGAIKAGWAALHLAGDNSAKSFYKLQTKESCTY